MKNKNFTIIFLLGPFSDMVHNEAYRRNFVRSSVKFLRDNGFDGLGKNRHI